MEDRAILVAGGGGFVGGHLVKEFRDQGYTRILEPINLGSDELVTINGLVDIVEDIAGVKLSRHYNLNAPKGVNGRNSDNTLILEKLDWAPPTGLREGMRETYAWIAEQYELRAAGKLTRI